jgi:hypothetical protein
MATAPKGFLRVFLKNSPGAEAGRPGKAAATIYSARGLVSF